MIGTSYLTDNAKILNYIPFTTTADCEASFINWNDIPYTTLSSGKVTYLHTTGAFNDVNLVLLNDVNDQYYTYAYLSNVAVISGKTPSYVNTLYIAGKKYTYTNTSVSYGSNNVVRVSLINGVVNCIWDSAKPDGGATTIQAIDAKRIKLNNVIYRFRNDVQIYYRDGSGVVTVRGTNDVDLTQSYSNVSVYLDKPFESNGKVAIVMINQ